jgi:hypothetical protein
VVTQSNDSSTAFILDAPKFMLYLLIGEKKQNPVSCVRTFKGKFQRLHICFKMLWLKVALKEIFDEIFI